MLSDLVLVINNHGLGGGGTMFPERILSKSCFLKDSGMKGNFLLNRYRARLFIHGSGYSVGR